MTRFEDHLATTLADRVDNTPAPRVDVAAARRAGTRRRTRRRVLTSSVTGLVAASAVGALWLTGGSAHAPDTAVADGSDTAPSVSIATTSASPEAEPSPLPPVTRKAYVAGFVKYRSCLADAGYEMVKVDTSGRIIEYAVPAAAVEDGTPEDNVDKRCYERHFRDLDIAWQVKEPRGRVRSQRR